MIINGPGLEKICLPGLRTTKAQSQTGQLLCYLLSEQHHIRACYKWNFNFLASLYSWGHYVGKPEVETHFPPSSEKSQTIGFLRNTGLGPLEINVGPFIGPPTRWPGFSVIKKIKKTFSDSASTFYYYQCTYSICSITIGIILGLSIYSVLIFMFAISKNACDTVHMRGKKCLGLCCALMR